MSNTFQWKYAKKKILYELFCIHFLDTKKKKKK